jgi:site-specific recombinase XerD
MSNPTRKTYTRLVQRMRICVQRGKGAKDRYVPLPAATPDLAYEPILDSKTIFSPFASA